VGLSSANFDIGLICFALLINEPFIQMSLLFKLFIARFNWVSIIAVINNCDLFCHLYILHLVSGYKSGLCWVLKRKSSLCWLLQQVFTGQMPFLQCYPSSDTD